MLPDVFRYPNFRLYFPGVVLSQVGSRATVVANLWTMYQLTSSTLDVGLIGTFQAVSLLILSPLGGAYADRLDRKRLLQATQALSMLVSCALAGLAFTGLIQPWHLYLSTLLISAANTFDQPTRQALIPAMLPRELLVKAFALLNPSRELAVLLAPGIAGTLIAVANGKAGWVYLFDAVTYVALVLILMFLHVPPLPLPARRPTIWASIGEGMRFVAGKPILWQLVTLDLAATVFGAYSVLLPALARDVFHVGPQGYGLLSAAPSAGAILGSIIVFRLAGVSATGQLTLLATVAFGLADVALAQSGQAGVFGLGLVAATCLGMFDALATTVRHAAVQLETPDELRGRATSLYTMASAGGPSLGQTLMGALAAALGPTGALTLGALVPIGYAGYLAIRGGTVRSYRGVAAPAH
jgi:MFS family permease